MTALSKFKLAEDASLAVRYSRTLTRMDRGRWGYLFIRDDGFIDRGLEEDVRYPKAEDWEIATQEFARRRCWVFAANTGKLLEPVYIAGDSNRYWLKPHFFDVKDEDAFLDVDLIPPDLRVLRAVKPSDVRHRGSKSSIRLGQLTVEPGLLDPFPGEGPVPASIKDYSRAASAKLVEVLQDHEKSSVDSAVLSIPGWTDGVSLQSIPHPESASPVPEDISAESVELVERPSSRFLDQFD